MTIRRYPGRRRRRRVIASGNLVLVGSRARLFYARVAGAERVGRLALVPLERHVRGRSAAITDVVDHWSRTQTAGPARPARGQLQLDGWDR